MLRSVLAAIVIVIISCQIVAAQRPPRPGNKPKYPNDGMFGPGMPEEELGPQIADPDEKPPQPPKKYKEIRLTKKENSELKRFPVGGILRTRKFDQNQATFDAFINRFFLGRWTIWENRTSLPGYRKELRRYFQQTKSGEVYDHLNVLTLNFMNELVHGNYNPAAQINAMLAIGELNSVERGFSSDAVPYAAALKSLLDAINDDKLSDALHAAAVVGVLRHTEAGINNDDARRETTDAMLRLATADPPTGPSAAGREWIMAQAVDVLGLLGSAGNGNRVFNALSNIVADTRLSYQTRGIAAAALGRLNYAGATGIDPLETAAKIARFAADSCTAEIRISKETAKPVERRRIKQRLEASLAALGGADDKHKGIVALAKNPEQTAQLDEMRNSIKALSDLLEDKKSEEQDMAPPIEELSGKLNAWLEKLKGEAGGS